MKIELSQSGGYAGETIKLKEIDADKMPAAVKKQLNELLQKTDFFNLQKIGDNAETGADMLTYTLKINKGKNKNKEISFGDAVNDDSHFSKLVNLIKSL